MQNPGVSENLGYVIAASMVEREMESRGLCSRIACYVTMDKSLAYSEPQSPYLHNETFSPV